MAGAHEKVNDKKNGNNVIMLSITGAKNINFASTPTWECQTPVAKIYHRIYASHKHNRTWWSLW